MKRTLEELESDLTAALAAKKAADLKYRSVLHELERHPAKKQKQEDEDRARLRHRLPGHLYTALVQEASNPLKRLSIFETLGSGDNEQCNTFEISLDFANGQHRRFRVPFWGDKLDNDGVIDQFTTIAFKSDVTEAWKLARESNRDDPARALAALVFAAAVHYNLTDPHIDFLMSVYEDGEKTTST